VGGGRHRRHASPTPSIAALGAFTFTMTALPGTPAIQNAIPMPFFGTTPFAAPGLGIITGAIMLGLGWLYLERRASTLGAGFGEDRRAETVVMASEDRPAFLLAAPPLVLVIAVNLLFTFVVIPAMDTDFLAQPLYGETDVGDPSGSLSEDEAETSMATYPPGSTALRGSAEPCGLHRAVFHQRRSWIGQRRDLGRRSREEGGLCPGEI
jgi:hypothetical protein